MKRTPEQRAADEALEEAVRTCAYAYTAESERGVIVDFVVVYVSRQWDEEDGEDLTAVRKIVSWPTPPAHTVLGMLKQEATVIEHSFVCHGYEQ